MLFLSAHESNDAAQDLVPEPINIQHDAVNLGKLSHVQQEEAYTQQARQHLS